MTYSQMVAGSNASTVPRDVSPWRIPPCLCGGGSRRLSERDLVLLALCSSPSAIYGGYFGGGMGIMMLATLAIAGMRDIHEMNGLKSLLGAAINGVALIEFVGRARWPGRRARDGRLAASSAATPARRSHGASHAPTFGVRDRHCMGDDGLFLSPLASRPGGPSLRLSLHPPDSPPASRPTWRNILLRATIAT